MAGRIPQNFIDDLLARADIVEIIDARVPLKKAGRDFVACCPFHNEKTPSFSVSPSKQFYHCFGCGAHGTAIGFLMEYDHLEFVEAIKELAKHLGVPMPETRELTPAEQSRRVQEENIYDVLAEAARFYQAQLRHHPQAPQAIDYLKNRGLSGEIAKEFAIGYAPTGWNNLLQALGQPRLKLLIDAGLVIEKEDGKYYDRFRERIMFPIRDRRGRVIGFGGRVLGDGTPKYLNSPETAVFHKGRELYGLYEARQSVKDWSRVLVVEGYMDTVALAQYGIHNVVATLGTAVTPEHLDLLFRNTSEVVFCFDGDRAGRQAAWRGLENALPAMHDGRQVRFIFLPEGEDPDTLVRRIGADEFNKAIAGAIPLSEFMLDQLGQQVDLRSVDGQAQLVEKLRPLISRMPAGAYRTLMVERLAEWSRMKSHDLLRVLGQPDVPSAVPAQRSGGARDKQPPSLLRHAIAMLLQHPSLAAQLEGPLPFSQLRQPGVALLVEMIELLRDSPHITTAALLEHWRERPESRHLASLLQRDILLDEDRDDLAAEFTSAIAELNRQYNIQRRDELLDKFKFAGLDAQEREELQQLTRQVRT
ncbi:MAG TPA: DNA primase [Gammaproteobacteria bacterium]